MAQPPLLGDAVRPVGDQRRRDAALVDPVLVEAERRVGEVGPGGAVALVGVLRAGHAQDVVAEVHRLAAARGAPRDHQLVDQLVDRRVQRNVLGAGAVVGEEDDQRVVELAGLLERGEDPADALVHAVDLRRVDLHAAQRPGAELRVGLGLAPRRLARVALGQLPVLLEQARGDELVEPRLAKRVPAGVEPALVLRDVLLVGMQRPVRRGVGDVLEERLVRPLLGVALDVLDRLVADRVGVEEAFGMRLVLDVLVAAGQRVRVVEAAGADDRAVELVEAALQRPGVGRLRSGSRRRATCRSCRCGSRAPSAPGGW